MDIDLAVLADGAQVAGEKLYVLGGGWTTIWAREFPATHRGSFALAIRVAWLETNVRHRLLVEARTDDGSVVQEIVRGEFEAGRPPGIKAGSEQLVMLTALVDFKLDAPGAFVVVVEIDGQLMKRIGYSAAQLNAAGQPAA